MSKKILILRPGAMGDVCMAVPFVAALARHGAVHWLLHRIYEPIPRRFNLDCHLIPFAPIRSRGSQIPIPPGLIDRLRNERFDAVLDLAHWPVTAALAARLQDVPIRAIVHDSAQDKSLGVNPHGLDLYAPFNVRLPVPSSRHQVAKWQALARHALDIDVCLDWPLRPQSCSGDRMRVFVHPHASKPKKAWPADRFARVLRGLKGARTLECLINSGSRYELPTALGLWLRLRAAGIAARIVWMDRSCQRLAAALQACDFALGCDSGPMHFAALLGVPSVVVFGPYAAKEFGPLWRSIPVAPAKPGTPARAVPAAAVLRTVRSILETDVALPRRGAA